MYLRQVSGGEFGLFDPRGDLLIRPRQPRGGRPWMVGTDPAKATVMGRLRNASPGTPGYSHFPADRQLFGDNRNLPAGKSEFTSDSQPPYVEQLLGEVGQPRTARASPSASGGQRKASAMRPSTLFSLTGASQRQYLKPGFFQRYPEHSGLAPGMAITRPSD